MKLRHLAAWFSGVVLLGAGATLLSAQPQRVGPGRTPREKLRAEVITLRTEVEMLRFDYELARDSLLEDLKTSKGFKLAGGLMAALSGVNANSLPEAPQPQARPDPKKEAEAARAAEKEEKKQAAEEAAFLAERKKELARLFALLAEKRLDLEEVEKRYREIAQ